MTDTLKTRVAVTVEAEHIYDIDVADPIRNVLLERVSNLDSTVGTLKPNRIWLKRLTIAPGATVIIDLFAGTYGGVNMLDGFGVPVHFEAVHALHISTDPSSFIMLQPSMASPWMAMFAPGGAILLLGDSTFTIEGRCPSPAPVPWLVDAGGMMDPWGRNFDLLQNAGAPAAATVDVCIIGYHP